MRSYPWALSGGQCQRVVTATALISEPAVVVADEPTSALDASVRRTVLDALATSVARTGSTMLLISHDLGVVDLVCDRVFVMYGGRIVEDAATASLWTSPRHPYTKALIDSYPSVARTDTDRLTKLRTIAGSVPFMAQMPQGCPFKNRCPRRIEACDAMPPRTDESDHHSFWCWNPVRGELDYE